MFTKFGFFGFRAIQRTNKALYQRTNGALYRPLLCNLTQPNFGSYLTINKQSLHKSSKSTNDKNIKKLDYNPTILLTNQINHNGTTILNIRDMFTMTISKYPIGNVYTISTIVTKTGEKLPITLDDGEEVYSHMTSDLSEIDKSLQMMDRMYITYNQ
jgi:hypothetical protein